MYIWFAVRFVFLIFGILRRSRTRQASKAGGGARQITGTAKSPRPQIKLPVYAIFIQQICLVLALNKSPVIA